MLFQTAQLAQINNASIMMSYLFQTVSSSGELGTITNVIEQSLVVAINDNTAQLQQLLGAPLPQVRSMPSLLPITVAQNAQPPMYYAGPSRLAVPTARTLLATGEALNVEVGPACACQPTHPSLQAIVISNSTLNDGGSSVVQLWYRPLGSEDAFTAQSFALITPQRAVFAVSLQPQVC